MKIHAITLRILASLFFIILGITQAISVHTATDAGGACSVNSDCDSGLCQSSICIGKKIGQACSDDDQCTTGLCQNSFCVCDDQDKQKSDHCENTLYGGYGGTASGWKCMDSDQDPDSSRAEWNFCKKADYLSSLPKNSTNDVKYPVEKKILMGYACDDHDACLSQRGGYHVCDSTTIASTVENDPWFAQDKELKICNLGTIVNVAPANTIQEVCTEQYGDGTWVKADGTGDLANLHVCQNTAKNNWMPTSLQTMRTWAGPTSPSSPDNLVQTTFLGFDISMEAPELVTPETKIGIPGVFFTNITKETHITTDEFGASWLNIPFLGEFISAIYKYSVGLISLIAVMVLIISGVQIITSAGNSETISSAKHRIVSSVIAIVITAGSYTILYTVNPDLVNLKNLKILVIPQKLLEEPEIEASETVNSDNGTHVSYQSDQSAQTTPGTTPPPTTPGGSTLPRPYTGPRGYVCDSIEGCRQWCAQHPPETWPEQSVIGSMPISETQVGLRAPGIRTSKRIPIMLVEPLKAVGLKAQAHPAGPFTIQINSSWRSLEDAITRVCTKFPNNTGDLGTKLSFPGANAHNYAGGGAVDTILFDKNNEPITNPDFDTAVILQENSKTCTGSGSSKVCTSTGDGKWKIGNKILAELFYSVVGWKRFTGEVWHFDYNTSSGCRTNTCTTTAVGDSNRGVPTPLCTCKQ